MTGEAGCLLIVKNYTGDRLNFGLAAERARAFGLKVKWLSCRMISPFPDSAGPRGLAGTLLVHKMAGACPKRGGDLAAVTASRPACGLRGHDLWHVTGHLHGAGICKGRPHPARRGGDRAWHSWRAGGRANCIPGARQAMAQIVGILAYGCNRAVT